MISCHFECVVSILNPAYGVGSCLGGKSMSGHTGAIGCDGLSGCTHPTLQHVNLAKLLCSTMTAATSSGECWRELPSRYHIVYLS
mmetsp:Transcript_25810/g.60298  ORF Transcript_25810/g.60298 Transcript_25810/m.60298 type:complete len:85 (-) Transcript_25810:3-257(-)